MIDICKNFDGTSGRLGPNEWRNQSCGSLCEKGGNLKRASVLFSHNGNASHIYYLKRLISECSMQSFLKPLTTQEEAYYLKQMKEGDLEARKKLIEHNLRLVAHIIKKYNNMEQDPEDLISIGTIGLIKAVDTYDISKGIKLVTYASRCIENEILMHLRSSKRKKETVWLYQTIGEDKEGNEIKLVDIIEDPATSPLNKAEVLHKQINKEELLWQSIHVQSAEQR